ncbi:MAG: U32 family peptidase [Clostridia bacterium]
MNKIELLAPAGNAQKLKTALRFGADAVYIGGKDFSLRAFAGNFSDRDIKESVDFAHSLNKKVYVTVNIFARNADFERAGAYFAYLAKVGVDGVIVTDSGLINLCKKSAPTLPIHLSTQANTLNKYAVEFWGEQGICRVVLAREISLEEIADIHTHNPNVELEAFVHGAMCVSYSGRCLLSNYLNGRDANRGECVQSCRWKYTLSETSRHGKTPLEIEEDGRGAYILNSKDLNMLAHIGDLHKAGVCSFKIEGRMKSEFYIATVVNAYRRAIDEYLTFGEIRNIDRWERELRTISHREYTTAYLLGENSNTLAYDNEQTRIDYAFSAVVKGYRDGVATVEMRNRFKKGDVLEILSPDANFGKAFTVEEMKDEDGQAVCDAKLVQQILHLATPYALTEGDILRKSTL